MTKTMKVVIFSTLAGLTGMVMIATAIGLALLLPGTDSPAPVKAGGMWFAWLYEPQSNAFLRVWEDGSTEQHALTLAAGERMASSPQTFAPSGEQIAFCTFNESTQSVNFQIHSFNSDAAAKAGIAYPIVVPLGQGAQCAVSPHAFERTNQGQIAFGVLNYVPNDPNADLSRPSWELMIVDVTSGQVVQRIDANHPSATAITPDVERWAWMPVVHSFEGTKVTFEMAPWGTEYIPGENVAVWDTATGAVTLADNAAASAVNVEINPATLERVWVAADPNLPAAQPMGPMPSYNVVMYQQNADFDPQIIYHDPAVLPVQVEFVKGGESLAINAVQGFDPNAAPEEVGRSQWVLLDRAGTQIPLDLGNVYRVAGLRDGFAAWESNYETGSASLTRYSWTTDPLNPTVTTLWTGENPNWGLVWSFPQASGGGFAPFPAVTP